MKYRFCTYGDPVLRQKAEIIRRIDGALKVLSVDMLKIMKERKGVGLAAQQIGQTIQICVVDIPLAIDVAVPDGPRLNPDVTLPLVMLNPVLVAKKGAQRDTEGCLSVPEIWAPVNRAAEVTVTYLDIQGVQQELHARGMLARAIQHEIDHLHGVLFVDRVSPVKKITLAGKLKRLRKEKETELGIA
ncbi:MAG: peptide deformylase [Kiritimatiellae bacterium]|nr:peptide deformylase [Kiritimatiellia bacterium]